MIFAALAVLTTLVGSIEEPAVGFDKHVLPVLTKAGCNAGACHGAAAGRGGLRLSLFASNPAEDYRALVTAAEGRRINLANPAKSLLLSKPLEQIPHGGGQLLKEDSKEAALLAAWIRQGAPSNANLYPTQMIVSPGTRIAVTTGDEIELQVKIRWSDGTESIGTDATLLSTDGLGDAVILQDPLRVQIRRPGSHTIIARFREVVQPIVFDAPYPTTTGKASQPLPAVSPVALKSQSYIDPFIEQQLANLGLAKGNRASDSLWFRRLRLDLSGRLPTESELASFADDRNPEKYANLVDRILDSSEFEEYWSLRLARWFGMLGNPQEPNVAIAYANWIRVSLRDRISMRTMMEQMLTTTGDSELQGAVNFARSARDARHHAELVGSVWMGVRLQCANCHNHPLDRWTQADYHGFATYFSGISRGKIVNISKAADIMHPLTGEAAHPRLPGDRMTDRESATPEVVARWLVDPATPYVPRNVVNRLWKACMGRGLVEEVDDLRDTNPPSHPELLDRLAQEFVESGWQLRPVLRSIVLSDAYAREPKPLNSSSELDRWYVHALPKPLMPEVLLDALNDVLFAEEDAPLSVPTLRNGISWSERAVSFLDPTLPSDELDTLGRCKRSQDCSVAANIDNALSTKLAWLNGEIVNRRLSDKNSRLHQRLSSGENDQTILDAFSIRVTGKKPSEPLQSEWLNELQNLHGQQRLEWYQDWLWALLSSPDFLSNR